MAKLPKYRFGGVGFPSKEAVRQHASALRIRHAAGATVSEVRDVAFLRELIERHVERPTKIGVGVKRFFVDYAPDHPGTCFWIERVDGSKTDFGVPACLHDVGRINRMALRMAIRAQLDTFKATALTGCGETFVSNFSGKSFPVVEAVADHVRPFDEIILEFFGARSIDIETTMLTRSIDQRSDPVWVDPKLLDEFLAHHQACPLRLVQWRENLSEIKTRSELLSV